MKVYAELLKCRGVVIRICRDRFRNQERIDLRVYFENRPGDADSRIPTKKGIDIGVRDLPALRAALESAEADALRAGLLELEDYTDAGLEPPAALRGAA